jgi:hypothetical protein
MWKRADDAFARWLFSQPSFGPLTPNKEIVVSKLDKLVAVLTDAANLVTPSNGGTNDDYVGHDPAAINMELAYRVGRALTLARSIAREQD